MIDVKLTVERLKLLRCALEIAIDCIGDLTPRQSIKDHSAQLDGASRQLRFLLRDVQDAIKET